MPIGREQANEQKFQNLTMDQWEQIGLQYGLKKEEPWYKKAAKGAWSGFTKTIDFIERPLSGIMGSLRAITPAGQARGENPLEEFWDGMSGRERDRGAALLADVGVENKYVKGIVGFALDVALDPTTYIGAGGLLKIGGKKNLTKAGRDLLKSSGDDFLQEAVKRNVTELSPEWVKLKNIFDVTLENELKRNPDKYFKGVTFMGKNVVPRKALTPLDLSDEALENAPSLLRNLGKPIKNLDEALSNAFGINKNVPTLVGQEVNRAKNLMQKTIDDNADIAKEVFRKGTFKNFTPEKQKQMMDVLLFNNQDYVKNIYKNSDEVADMLTDLGVKITKKQRKDPEIITRLLDEFIEENAGEQGVKGLKALESIRKRAIAETNSVKPWVKFRKAGGQVDDDVVKFMDTDLKEFIAGFGERHNFKEGLDFYFPSMDRNKLAELAERSMPATIGERKIDPLMGKVKDILDKPFEAYTIKDRILVRNEISRQATKDILEMSGLRMDPTDPLSKFVKTFDDLEEAAIKWKVNPSDYVPVKLLGDKAPRGFIKAQEMELLKNTLFPEMKTVDMLARASGYDKFTDVFKEFVTAWFPAFHARNAMSGVVQNYEVLGKDVFRPDNVSDTLKVIRGSADDEIAIKVRTLVDGVETEKIITKTAKELQGLVSDRFYGSSRYISDFSKYADDLINIKEPRKLNPRKLGNFVETNQKIHAFVTRLKQNGGDINDAIQMAEKAGFDYGAMSKFEQSVMKRIIPFYAFARKNAELQARTLIANPSRIVNQKKALDMFSEMLGGPIDEETIAGLPPWVRDKLGIRISNGQVLSNLDFPVQEFFERVSDPIGTSITSMNPIIKMPFEFKAGYDFFRGKPIEEISSIREPLFRLLESDNTPDFIKDIFDASGYEFTVKTGNEKGQKKKGYKANPTALWALRNIPSSRIQNTLETIFADDLNTQEKMFSFIMGAKLYDIDQGMQEYYESKDLYGRWADELQKQGEGYTFESFFIPKTEEEKAAEKRRSRK